MINKRNLVIFALFLGLFILRLGAEIKTYSLRSGVGDQKLSWHMICSDPKPRKWFWELANRGWYSDKENGLAGAQKTAFLREVYEVKDGSKVKKCRLYVVVDFQE